jgi:hypothetical protein
LESGLGDRCPRRSSATLSASWATSRCRQSGCARHSTRIRSA